MTPRATSPTAAVIVNFTQFRLEGHVEKALRVAWAVSGGGPVNACHLLLGALSVARTEPSNAFVKIAALLPLQPPATRTNVAPLDPAALPVVPPLAASFAVAEVFLRDKKTVWGRDFVTLALLAKDDPSLEQVASEAGVELDSVRNQWLDFVCATDQRRPPAAWRKWWESARVPLPGETPAPATAASAYLFIWDPARAPLPKMDGRVQEAKEKGSTVYRWSTGTLEQVSRGERVFLLRQGEPRGLVGVGEVVSDVMAAPHWDEAERATGHKAYLVDVEWKALAREPFVDLERLIAETGDTAVWSSRIGVALTATVRERLEKIWPQAWARTLGGLPDTTWPAMEPRHWIARFDADTARTDDSLKIDRYVNAFARVIASRDLVPPLSIGLFGDWGSGKSFFMDRLHERIADLAAREEAAVPLYLHRICQMRFNAWHYTETNLWASLVSTIFKELRLFLDGPEGEKEDFTHLLERLEVVRELRREAVENLKKAKEALTDAQGRVVAARQELGALKPAPPPSDAELRSILGKSVADVLTVDRDKTARLLEAAAETSGRSEFSEAAQRVRAGADTVEDVRKVVDEAVHLTSSAGFWWRILSGARLYKSAGFWITLAVLVAIPVILFKAAGGNRMPEGWAHAWTLIGQLLTVLAATVAWARSHLGQASSVFDQLGGLRARIEARIDEARTHDRRQFEKERDAALAAEAKAKANLEDAEAEEKRAREQERQAEEAVRESTSEARLGRFIRERNSSADYEKHLGLIAMIHRDFNKLSDLMRAVREKPHEDPTLPRIDRIVLYIDDLDRCHPPEKVVRVLEAVHLLLSFPLFVVVVGVDSRWVSRALYKHYDGMLADEAIAREAGAGAELHRAPAESQDFLEKIFQVPFWLRRMEPIAIQRLIHRLIPPAEIEAAPVTLPPAPVAPPADAPPPMADGEHATGKPAEAPAKAEARRLTAEAETEDDLVGDAAGTAPSEALKITQAELTFMDEVAPLMPRTPRSVKRFVNIYRLYKAALSPLTFPPFVGSADRPGHFRAVQVLLALVTGTPRFAQHVFSHLHDAEYVTANKLSDLVKTLDHGENDESSHTTLEALREFAHGRNDLDLEDLRKVSPLVSRYSVHHMISQAPGEAGLG